MSSRDDIFQILKRKYQEVYNLVYRFHHLLENIEEILGIPLLSTSIRFREDCFIYFPDYLPLSENVALVRCVGSAGMDYVWKYVKILSISHSERAFYCKCRSPEIDRARSLPFFLFLLPALEDRVIFTLRDPEVRERVDTILNIIKSSNGIVTSLRNVHGKFVRLYYRAVEGEYPYQDALELLEQIRDVTRDLADVYARVRELIITVL